MSITVHVVDATRSVDSKGFDERSKVERGHVVIKVAPSCGVIEQIIEDIKAEVKPRTLDTLIFYGHGRSGIQGISYGTGEGNTKEEVKDAVKEENIMYYKQLSNGESTLSKWARLRPLFSEHGFVILKGCNSADGEEGRKLISELSKVLGVAVKASNWTQIVGRSDLAGNVVTARPDGKFSHDKVEGSKVFAALPPQEQLVIAFSEFRHRAAQGTLMQDALKVLNAAKTRFF